MNSLFSIDSPLWRFTDKVLRLIWLNLLWFLCSIPLITIGASTTALYSVTLKYVRDEEGYLTSSFFQAFKNNFRSSTTIWMLMSVFNVFLVIDLILYLRIQSTGALEFFMLTIFFTALLIFLFVNLYIYAVIAYFQNTTIQYIKNAFLLSITHWPVSILMIVSIFGIFLIGMLAFPPILFISVSGFCYMGSKFFRHLFDQLA